MFAAIDPRWIRIAAFAGAIATQIFALRSAWTFNTQTRPDLQKMGVRSGYSVLLESSADPTNETLLHYQASAAHNHRVTLEMDKGRLSEQSQRYLAEIHPPTDASRITYAPERSGARVDGPPCRAMFAVEFAPQHPVPQLRSVRLYPPMPKEFIQLDNMRMIHLESSSLLMTRVSRNSDDGQAGPGCRELLTIGKWEQLMGKDVELEFIAEPDSRVTLTLSPDPKTEGRFHSGREQLDSLMIEPLSPRRLSIGPYGLAQSDQIRKRAGKPFLTVNDLALHGDFLELELSGVTGVPISEVLGGWKWLLLPGVNIPLIFWVAKALPRRGRGFRPKPVAAGPLDPTASGMGQVFLSYSWEDKDRVMEIYRLLSSSGAEPWIDREEIRGGAEWELSIKDQMRRSEHVIIFVSSHSIQKAGFAWAEIRMAVHIAAEQPEGAAFLIPVRLDDCKLPDLLSQWHCIDLFLPDGRQKLLGSLGINATDPSRVVQGPGQ